MNRIADLNRFYGLLERLESTVGGKAVLGECNDRMQWPRRGVYFFFEPGETRSSDPRQLRVVRVGTHALKKGSGTSLWNRLSNHQGSLKTGGGNHRGSIFRLLVGNALMNQGAHSHLNSWGLKQDTGKAAKALDLSRDVIKELELPLEQMVSAHIGAMPFLWLGIDDDSGPESLRGVIERNSIALLSEYKKNILDPQSAKWLGQSCDRERVRNSGLWNNNHVDENYDPGFLDKLESAVDHQDQYELKKGAL